MNPYLTKIFHNSSPPGLSVDFKTLLKRAAVIFFVTRLIIFGAAYAWLLFDPGKVALGPNEPIWHGDVGGHGAAAEPWRRWDALWFTKTVRDGYNFQPGAQSNTSVFPLYPLLIAGLGRAGMDHIWAGVLISNFALFGATMLLLLIGDKSVDKKTSDRAALAMMLFPSAFVLSGVYSESLFLLASLGAFYFAGKREWAEAALCGFAAALCRMPGAILLLPLAAEFFINRKEGEPRTRALWLLLVPMAPLLFFAHLNAATGSYSNYFHAQSHWQKAVDWPWVGLGWEIFPWTWNMPQMFNAGAALMFCCLAVATWKRFGATYGLLVVLGLIVPMCASRWIGMPRYTLVLFPAFFALADMLKNRWLFYAYMTASTALMLLCFRAFLNWGFSL